MNVGERAPDFTLKDGDGNDWKLSDHKGKTVTFLFYPGDNTPVCTKQLCSVRDNWSEYQKTDSVIVGISTDSSESHRGFADKFDLPLTLLADVDGEVIDKYGVSSWIPGKAARAVVVVNSEGIVQYHNVQSLGIFRPKDREVLKAIAEAD